jgi:hypothetical protein
MISKEDAKNGANNSISRADFALAGSVHTPTLLKAFFNDNPLISVGKCGHSASYFPGH